MKTYERKLTKVGQRSLAIVIPAEIVDELKLRERQKLLVRREGQRIVIEDWPGQDQPKS
jgi:antitoxin component of MazEF toxin-antitoxin module